MALFRRSIICTAKNYHLRHFSDKSESTFWEIVPKRWRAPRFPEPKKDSLTQKLAPSIATVRLVGNLNPFEAKKWSFSNRKQQEEIEGLRSALDQESKERGHTVSLAQFLVFSGAKVRFSSIPEWISREENYDKMPQVSELGTTLIAIDISHLNVDFVTIKTIKDLNTVTYFNAEGCSMFDDYCLDHISANLPGLEELDLSECPLITSRGLGVLYRFKRLRSLKLNKVESNAELELFCILLEEHFPNLKIEGVTYNGDRTGLINE